MNISEFCIRRPVFTILMITSIIFFGIISYIKLPINVLPNVDFPTIMVSASLPGADPTTMASTVALPLEKQFSTIAGIDSMSSINSAGFTQITIQFSLDRDISSCAQDVQAAISASLKQLPSSMTTPPSYKKLNPSEAPIYYIAITSDTVSLSDLDYYAETLIAQNLSMIDGVAQVLVYGSQTYAVRIQLDPIAMSAHNLSIDQVMNAVTNNNVNNPTGSLHGKHTYSTINVDGQIMKAAGYNDIIVNTVNNVPIYLSNIGKAIDSVQNDQVAAWFNNKRAIVLAIQKQPNTNTIAVVEGIKNTLPSLKKNIHAGINFDVVYDRSESIIDSVDDVKITLILAFILVIFIIYIFFFNWHITMIPSVALPVSIIGTYVIMYLFNFSIDNLSLLALTLCVGFVIDDAIVILENIIRHIELGKSKFQACIDGSKEVTFTIFSMTFSLIAVFIPVLFLDGIIGKLLHEFAITIVSAILISAFVSLTLSPMLCNLFLEDKITHKKNNYFENIFLASKQLYKKTLTQVIHYKIACLILFFATIIATIILFKNIQKGFLPDEDSGQIFCTTEADQNISFDSMILEQQKIANILNNNKYIESYISSVGASGRSISVNQGIFLIKLVERNKRPISNEIINDLRKEISMLTGIKAYMQNISSITVGAVSSKSEYQYVMQDVNADLLYEYAPKLQTNIQNIKGFLDVTSDLQISQPQIDIIIDRKKASLLGLSIAQIQNSLYSAYGSRQISTIYDTAQQYQVIMELLPEYRTDSNKLLALNYLSSTNNLIPLGSFAYLKDTVGPMSITHLGQLPAVTISFNLADGYSLSWAIDEIEKTKSKLQLPETINTSFQGTAQIFESSIQSLGILMILAIIVIYIILGMLYESFIHPLTVLSGIPTAGVGALIAMIICNKELDMYGFVGIIMLIGIVKKNAIMIIDFAISLQKEHNMEPEKAIIEACMLRYRPIMMTSLAAIFGSLPIAFAYGATGIQRQGLGIAVVGGLLTSQILTLYVTPVIYLYLDKWQNNLFKTSNNTISQI